MMMVANVASVVMPMLGRVPRCLQIVLRQHLPRRPPGTEFPRHQQALREMPKHLIGVVQHGDDGAVFPLPALNHSEEIAGRALIDGGEWLVEENDLWVLEK